MTWLESLVQWLQDSFDGISKAWAGDESDPDDPGPRTPPPW